MRRPGSATADLDEILRRFPPTLREANTTLVNLRGTIADLRPTVRAARPVAPLLNQTLVRLRPVARAGVRVIPDLRALIDRPGREDLLGVVRTMASVAATAVPAFRSAVATTEYALPAVRTIRAYGPDLVGGQVEGYGGAGGIYYDANGHYQGVSGQGPGFPPKNQGPPNPPPPSVGGLSAYRTHLDARCPGAATQPAPDHSNPWHPPRDGFPCKPRNDP